MVARQFREIHGGGIRLIAFRDTVGSDCRSVENRVQAVIYRVALAICGILDVIFIFVSYSLVVLDDGYAV